MCWLKSIETEKASAMLTFRIELNVIPQKCSIPTRYMQTRSTENPTKMVPGMSAVTIAITIKLPAKEYETAPKDSS